MKTYLCSSLIIAGVSMEEHIVRRLIYSKALLLHGIRHAEENSAVDSAFAILHFDNSMEMILNIILEYFGAPAKQERKFYEIINAANEVIKEKMNIDGNKLLNSREITNLHNVRNAIQHHGLIPDENEVRRYCILTQKVVDNVTSKLFGLEYEDLSLALLIKDEQIHELFSKANSAYEKANYQKTIIYCVTAFERAKNNEQILLHGSGIIIKKIIAQGTIPKPIEEYLEIVTEELEILKLRLDYKKYQKYRDISHELKPFLWISSEDAVSKVKKIISNKLAEFEASSLKDCARFCLDFTIESILRWESVPREGWKSKIEELKIN